MYFLLTNDCNYYLMTANKFCIESSTPRLDKNIL